MGSAEGESPLGFAEISRLHLTLLKIGGFIVFDTGKFHVYIKALLGYFMHACYTAITTMYLCNVATTISNTGSCDLGTMAECVGLCGAHFRFVSLYLRRETLPAMIEFCEELWAELTPDERIVFREFVRKSTYLGYAYLGLNLLGCFFYLTASQLPRIFPDANGTFFRLLPYPFYAEVASSPWYELSVTLQMVSMVSISASSVGADTAAPYFIMMLCAFLKALCSRVERLSQSLDKKKLETRITNCIGYHQKIVSLHKRVQGLTSSLFLAQIMCTTYNMSVLGLKLVGDDPDKIKYLPILCLMIVQLFMCQWAPDILLAESAFLEQATYFAPSIGYGKKKVNQLIHIFLMKSQQPLHLLAGGYIRLSMECFGSMITNAVSFFMVLRSIS